MRQDDPSALKEIVALVHNAAAKIGEANLTARAKFMVETINALKNNRMKTGIAASAIASEHIIRMKKLLGSLNTRNVRATEPLRIGLKDIRDSDRRGKWWLIGSSYEGPVVETEDEKPSVVESELRQSIDSQVDDVTINLLQLAKEQRMNTDIRRSIFITVMSATDCNDAYQRIMKLRLKKAQEIEIPKVLIQCAGAEQIYNPYYTLLSRKVCSDRRLKMAFQFSLWDLFRQMGEESDEEESGIGSEDETLNIRSIVNLAKLFGILITDGALGLNVLKVSHGSAQIRSSANYHRILTSYISNPKQGYSSRCC